jgi:hypothetical protein
MAAARAAAGQVGSHPFRRVVKVPDMPILACPLLGEQRKTYARIELFRF